MNNQAKGFTIVEILVTMVIVSSIIGIAFYAYNKLTVNVRSQSSSIEASMDKLVGLELFRLDIETAGFGIAVDESSPPVEWDTNSGALILRATMNNTNDDTLGWVFLKCQQGLSWDSGSVLALDERNEPSNDDLVFLDYRNKFAFSTNSSTTCPHDGHYIGYPVDTSIANGCTDQICTKITYTLSTTQNIDTCADGTKNLLRKVGAGSGTPILNCVADWELRFGLDSNGDGSVDSVVAGASLPTDPDDVRDQLKYVSFYALVQDSQYDRNYSYGNNTTIDGITLSFPTACTKCTKYHWKLIKKTVKFMNL